MQIKVFVKGTQGNLLKEKNKPEAIKAYQEAYDILQKNPSKTDPFTENQIITAENIESVHRGLLKLQPNQKVWNSLKEHYYATIEGYLERKNWREADIATDKLMLHVAGREEEPGLDSASLNNFSCPDLQEIDSLWVKHSNGRFGFSVQKKIWLETGNRLDITEADFDEQAFLRWISRIGWYDTINKGYFSYIQVIAEVKDNYPQVRSGILPGGLGFKDSRLIGQELREPLFSRVSRCGL